jgi:hypothetical protein
MYVCGILFGGDVTSLPVLNRTNDDCCLISPMEKN